MVVARSIALASGAKTHEIVGSNPAVRIEPTALDPFLNGGILMDALLPAICLNNSDLIDNP